MVIGCEEEEEGEFDDDVAVVVVRATFFACSECTRQRDGVCRLSTSFSTLPPTGCDFGASRSRS